MDRRIKMILKLKMKKNEKKWIKMNLKLKMKKWKIVNKNEFEIEKKK